MIRGMIKIVIIYVTIDKYIYQYDSLHRVCPYGAVRAAQWGTYPDATSMNVKTPKLIF